MSRGMLWSALLAAAAAAGAASFQIPPQTDASAPGRVGESAAVVSATSKPRTGRAQSAPRAQTEIPAPVPAPARGASPAAGTSVEDRRATLFLALQSAGSEDEAREKVKDLRLGGLAQLATEAAPLGAPALVSLAGVYTGTITFDNGADGPWDVKLDLLAKDADGTFSGKYDITVGNNGEPVAHASGVDNSAVFKSIPNDPNAILIEVMRNRGYLQVYPVAQQGLLAGNFYFRPTSAGGSPPDFQDAGTVILRK